MDEFYGIWPCFSNVSISYRKVGGMGRGVKWGGVGLDRVRSGQVGGVGDSKNLT